MLLLVAQVSKTQELLYFACCKTRKTSWFLIQSNLSRCSRFARQSVDFSEFDIGVLAVLEGHHHDNFLFWVQSGRLRRRRADASGPWRGRHSPPW